MRPMRFTPDDRGVVLIALLWILMALSVVALSFSRESFVEIAVARNTRDLSDGYYVARAGVADAIFQLITRRFFPRVKQLELQGPPDPIDLGRLTGRFGDGIYEVEIQDESGKINLNLVAEDQLRRLIEVIGIEKPDSDIIADSILDWRDVDNGHHPNGAEDDFYQTLNPPYRAKNGRFDTVEELLLVRGVTADYFYGHAEKSPDGAVNYKYGLSRCLTVYSASAPSVNVNYAPPPVLMSIPGMTIEIAQAIVQQRAVKPFVNPADLSQILRTTVEGNMSRFLSTNPTGVYTLTASGRREGSKVRRIIRAVVQLDRREPTMNRIVYWNENVPNL